MLTGEIKIHKEPVYVTQSYTSYKPYKMMTPKEQKDFEEKIEIAVEKAKQTMSIGDTCKIKAGTREMEITGWIDDPDDVVYYQDDLCVIYARDALYPASNSIRYSLSEFMIDTLVKK